MPAEEGGCHQALDAYQARCQAEHSEGMGGGGVPKWSHGDVTHPGTEAPVEQGVWGLPISFLWFLWLTVRPIPVRPIPVSMGESVNLFSIFVHKNRLILLEMNCYNTLFNTILAVVLNKLYELTGTKPRVTSTVGMVATET
jgi:hypothetical protein